LGIAATGSRYGNESDVVGAGYAVGLRRRRECRSSTITEAPLIACCARTVVGSGKAIAPQTCCRSVECKRRSWIRPYMDG
jgi:hypothetical protein